MTTDFDGLVTGLRSWAANRPEHVQAAVNLLIWHETWLRRPDFTGACVTGWNTMLINWTEAREFIDRGYARRGQRPLPASNSECRILDIAVALGEDQFSLGGFGLAHKRAVAQAFAWACGQRFEPAAVPAGPAHNHPDFIPGDASCRRCALDAEEKRIGRA